MANGLPVIVANNKARGLMDSKIKVDNRNRIVVPAESRKRLGIKPGDTLIVDVSEHHMILFK